MQELHISGYFFYLLQVLETINFLTTALAIFSILAIPVCIVILLDNETSQYQKKAGIVFLIIFILSIPAAIFLPNTKTATYMYAEYLVQTQKISSDQQLNVEFIYQKIQLLEKSK